MPASEIFDAVDMTESRLASAKSMLSRGLSFSRSVARPAAASATAAAVGLATAAALGRGCEEPAAGGAAGADSEYLARRRLHRLDSWEDDAGAASSGKLQASADRETAGSEWDVVSASLDESGGGQDFEAGLGLEHDLAEQSVPSMGRGRASSGRRRLRLPGRSDDHDRSLTPIWPMSLYPPSYREDVSVEQPVQNADGPRNSHGGDEQPAVSLSAAAESFSSASGPEQPPHAQSLEEEDDEAARLGLESTLAGGGARPPVLYDSDPRQQPGSPTAGASLAVQRGSGEKVAGSGGPVVGRAANNAVPAKPISRLTAVRQTAVRAGRVVLGASAFGARVRASSLPPVAVALQALHVRQRQLRRRCDDMPEMFKGVISDWSVCRWGRAWRGPACARQRPSPLRRSECPSVPPSAATSPSAASSSSSLTPSLAPRQVSLYVQHCSPCAGWSSISVVGQGMFARNC